MKGSSVSNVFLSYSRRDSEFVQRLAGGRACSIRFSDDREGILPTELPRQLAPDGVDLRPIGLHRAGRR